MTERTRRLLFVSLAVALIGILLLSMSLSELQLSAGLPFPGSGNATVSPGQGHVATEAQPGSPSVLGVILATAVLLFMLILPARLLRLVSWRNAMRIAIALILLGALVSLLPRVQPGSPLQIPEESSVPLSNGPATYEVAPLGTPPSLFLWIAGAGAFLSIGVILLLAWKGAHKPLPAKEALSQSAEEALRDLADGKDFHSVIVRCYLEMLEVLRTERGIERQESATAREFEDWLEQNSIPSGPIDQLTSLFEKARYSSDPVDPSDEQKGKESLEQIVRYCRGGPAVSR